MGIPVHLDTISEISLSVTTSLIIVISFTNSMHLVHALREHERRDGEDRMAVIAGCIRRIGPGTG